MFKFYRTFALGFMTLLIGFNAEAHAQTSKYRLADETYENWKEKFNFPKEAVTDDYSDWAFVLAFKVADYPNVGGETDLSGFYLAIVPCERKTGKFAHLQPYGSEYGNAYECDSEKSKTQANDRFIKEDEKEETSLVRVEIFPYLEDPDRYPPKIRASCYHALTRGSYIQQNIRVEKQEDTFKQLLKGSWYAKAPKNIYKNWTEQGFDFRGNPIGNPAENAPDNLVMVAYAGLLYTKSPEFKSFSEMTSYFPGYFEKDLRGVIKNSSLLSKQYQLD